VCTDGRCLLKSGRERSILSATGAAGVGPVWIIYSVAAAAAAADERRRLDCDRSVSGTWHGSGLRRGSGVNGDPRLCYIIVVSVVLFSERTRFVGGGVHAGVRRRETNDFFCRPPLCEIRACTGNGSERGRETENRRRPRDEYYGNAATRISSNNCPIMASGVNLVEGDGVRAWTAASDRKDVGNGRPRANSSPPPFYAPSPTA